MTAPATSSATTAVMAKPPAPEEPRTAEAHVARAVVALERDVEEARHDSDEARDEVDRWQRALTSAETRLHDRQEALETMNASLDTLTGGAGGSLRRTRLLEEARADHQ